MALITAQQALLSPKIGNEGRIDVQVRRQQRWTPFEVQLTHQIIPHPSSFIYPSLTDPSTLIRVVDILPSLPHETIQCTYHILPFKDEHQPYECLSYVWGDAAVTVDIIVDSRPLRVASNLEKALCSLRQSEVNRRLWADAIGIDQLNNEEKSKQVPMMGEIYAASSGCLVWLGHAVGNEASQKDFGGAFEFIETLASLKEDLDNGRPFEIPDFDTSCLLGVEKLMNNPWWSRVWTVQEVMFPANVVVIWVNRTISWQLFRDASIVLSSIHSTPNLNPSTPFVLASYHFNGPVFTVRNTIIRFGSEHPLTHLIRFNYRLATDDRDKVLAHLSFFSEGDRATLGLNAGYNLTTA
jgi:hypothetical protein